MRHGMEGRCTGDMRQGGALLSFGTALVPRERAPGQGWWLCGEQMENELDGFRTRDVEKRMTVMRGRARGRRARAAAGRHGGANCAGGVRAAAVVRTAKGAGSVQ